MKFAKLTSTVAALLILMQILHAQPQNIVIKTDYYDLKETAVAVNPNNSNIIMAGWNRWLKYSTNPNKYGTKPDYGFSTNGGSTWTTGTLPIIDDPTSEDDYELGFDPSCVFDDNNNAYYTYIMKKKGGSLGPVFISKTSDYGNNWSTYQVSDLNYGQDKCYMTIDNTGGNYDGRIYIAWVDLKYTNHARILLRYATPTTGTITFGDEEELDEMTGYFTEESYLSPVFFNPTTTYDILQGPVPEVAPNGDVCVVWVEIPNYSTPGGNGSLKFSKSTNGGESFSSPSTITNVNTFWHLGIPAFRPGTLPTIAIDPNNSNIYIAYTQYDSGDLNIYYVRSTNGGSTWSSPSIATATVNNHQFMPWLSIGSTGIISLFYTQGTNQTCDYYIAQSHNFGQSFQAPNYLVTNQSTNPYDARLTSVTAGDYVGIAQIDADDIYPIWFDFRSGSSADIVGAKVNPPPPAPSNFSKTIHNNAPKITWENPNVIDFDYNEIWRKWIEGSYNSGWQLKSTTTNTYYVDTDFIIGGGKTGQVHYKVRTKDDGGNFSPFTNQVYFHYSGTTWKIAVNNDVKSEENKPEEYSLETNYPNPFNPSTQISYQIPNAGFVNLVVYNSLGQKIATLVNEIQKSGKYTVKFDATDSVNGVYIYTLQVNDYIATRKMIVLK